MSEITDLLIFALLAIGAYYYLTNRQQTPTTGTGIPVAVGSAGSCDESLWNSVWQVPNKPRLIVVKKCTTITGKVGRTSEAPDGDFNFDLKPDSAYSSMASKGAQEHNGFIWCEVICQHAVRKSSEPDMDKFRMGPGGCKSYKGAKMGYLPKTGDRVAVTGAYVKDVREGGHMEIHPVTSIKKL